MKELRKIYELLEDASTAIQVYNNTISIMAEKPFFELHTTNDTSLFFIDCGYDLVNKYNIRSSVDDEGEFIEGGLEPRWIKYTSEEVGLMLENILFQLDKESRIAVIRKIIRKSEDILYLSDIEFQFISCMLGFVSYGAEERFVEVEGKGRMSFDEISNLIASLVIVSTQFLFHLGTNCIDFGIEDARTLVQKLFPDDYQGMNMGFFDEEIEVHTDMPLFSRDTISKIYNKCNSIQWENITENDFVNLLNSNGYHPSLTIRNKEKNRTKCVFKMMANYIKDEDKRKIWIDGIKKNIFNDVEFMKSTLRTNKLSSGYSDKDVKFSSFLDSL